jgi:hypothetical protein
MGFSLGVIGFVFAMGALAKVRRLETKLKEIGVLK